MTEIHALIITLNEELHIERCIRSIRKHCDTITVVDSGSTDKTVVIAQTLGAQVVNNPFINHAAQINIGIDHLSGRGGWLLRIDADEIIDDDSSVSLFDAVSSAGNLIDGLLVQRRIHFLGRRIRRGGIEPSWQLRVWRNDAGRCEQRWMDEHIRVAGGISRSGIVISDVNLNPLSWWTAKHNSYASREAIEILNVKHKFLKPQKTNGNPSPQARMKRWIKNNIYSYLPHGSRASAYFWYRYLIRLGFLDGAEGYYFHSLQARWYRTLVDAKIYEIEQYSRARGGALEQAIKSCTGISVRED